MHIILLIQRRQTQSRLKKADNRKGVNKINTTKPDIYRISGNFLINVILAFSAMSFELQIIEYAEIIFRIIIFKTLNRKKNHWSKLKMLHTFPIFANFVTREKTVQILKSVRSASCNFMQILFPQILLGIYCILCISYRIWSRFCRIICNFVFQVSHW